MNQTKRRHPFWELVIARLKEFIREPEAVFWVYGFPLLMTLVLGVAFREKPVEQFSVDVAEGPRADWIEKALRGESERFKIQRGDFDRCKQRLRKGDTALVVRSAESASGSVTYLYDPFRPESGLTQKAVNEVLQKAAGQIEPLKTTTEEFSEQGGRYIDFLVPGLLGMGIMGGGLWGVGFVIVDMRIRKLLKRFLATPMRRPDFLLAVMTSRFLFMLPEVLILLVFAYFVFNVVIQGSWLLVLLLVILGGLTFSGLGLLIASRAKTLEAVSGLMNLVMLPMWVLSGIFFSAARFPDFMQPLIKALPLTLLIDGLRAVMNEGAGLLEIKWYLIGLMVWGVLCFLIGLKIFRWQ